MKVLHIGKYFAPFRGGIENYMLDVMVALGRQGIDCSAVVHKHERSFRSTDELLGTGKTRFHVIQAGTWFKFMYTPFSPSFPVLMRRFLRRHQPDILHLHMPNPSAFWAFLLKSARKIPWVVHWHADVVASDLDPRLRWFYLLYRPLEQLMLRHSEAIIVTSQAYLDHSEPLANHRDKCHVVPLGLDPSRHRKALSSEATPSEGDDDRPLRVLAIGRLTYYKGFQYLVKAASLVGKLQVDIVGGGDREKQLREQISVLGIEDKVILHGRVSDETLQEMIVRSDCICLPSIERTEAFGMVLLEAMLFGKATVVSDVPGTGMGWILEHGVTGFKVPPGDAQSLADTLGYLQENRELTRAMGLRGKQKFDREFHIDHSAALMLKVYQSLVKCGKTNAGNMRGPTSH